RAVVVPPFAAGGAGGDRLYGSVTSQDIAGALQEQEDLVIDRRMIQLREPLRQLGEFEVGVRVASGVEPKLKVRIVSTEEAVRLQEAGAASASEAPEASEAAPDAAEEESATATPEA